MPTNLSSEFLLWSTSSSGRSLRCLSVAGLSTCLSVADDFKMCVSVGHDTEECEACAKTRSSSIVAFLLCTDICCVMNFTVSRTVQLLDTVQNFESFVSLFTLAPSVVSLRGTPDALDSTPSRNSSLHASDPTGKIFYIALVRNRYRK